MAVTATTLSLLAVFLPLGLWVASSAASCLHLVLTSSFAIAVSLLVSFTLTPMLAARLIKRSSDKEEALSNGEPSLPIMARRSRASTGRLIKHTNEC